MKKGRMLTLKRILAGVLALAMICGYLPAGLRGSHIAKAEETIFGKVSDPDTHDRAQDIFAGTTLNAGRVMVGKFVNENGLDFSNEAAGASWLASAPENFLIAISQASQSVGISSEIPVPIDAVFVLDTSGSMAYDIDSTQQNVSWADQRATHMVNAANDAIESLLAANSLNRVAVVAFSDSTTTLSTLYSYTGTAATNHLTWNGSSIVGRDTDGTTGSSRNGKSGGTNIHAGIAAGAQILANATNTTVTINGKEVSRIPFLIVLSDGAPTYSGSNDDWTNPSGTQGPGNGSYVGNGFLPVLTASYYKNVIDQKYFGDNVSSENHTYMYTIGVGVDGLSATDKALAEITLNPKENMNANNQFYRNNTNHDFEYYWQQYQADNTFEIQVNNGDTYTIGKGSYWENQKENWRDPDNWVEITFDNHQPSVTSLLYNDNYYPANNASGLEAAFRSIVVEIQKRAIAYPTLTNESMTADYSGYVTFRDVIGEYMEVKDMKGVIADGQLFRGEVFAKFMNMKQTEVDGDPDAQAFMNALIHSMEVRFGLRLPGETDATHGSMEAFLNDAWNWAHDRDENGQVYADGTKNPNTQMYYDDSENFDNSICWWGHTSNDGAVQLLGWAADDSIEYIETAKEMAANGEAYRKGVGSAVAEGADYVARSYFFYGSADGTTTYNKAYLDFSVTVMRDLNAPYTQTVVISAPASLLAMQRVLIYDTDKTGKITAYFDEVVPTRVVYEVGLRDDVTAESAESVLSEEYKKANKVDGGYVFYTNEWLRNPADGEAKALTYATFSSALRNDYYVFEKNTPVYVKDGNSYVKYTGTEQPSGRGYYYAHEYYTWDADATAEQGAAGVDCSDVKVEYIEMEIPAPANTTQVKWDSAQGCWVILAGTFKAQSLVESGIEEKTENKTGTGDHIAHPVRTGGETEPKYAVYLGNNGKLTFATAEAKSVFNANGDDIDGLTAMVGDELTYQVRVTNTKANPADATIVDTIPLGTELVEGSVKVYKDGTVQTGGYSFTQNASTLTWNFAAIPAGSAYVAEFKVKVTELAMDQSTVSNQASVTIGENTYQTNLVSNPIEGKKATGATSTVVPADGVQVGDQIVYTIQYYNDTDKVADVKIVDQIPAGTVYVDGSATNGGSLTGGVLNWTIANVAPGTGGSVSFKVQVTAAALTVNPFTNTATIQIGNNAPTQSTNEVKIDVKIGDLVLSKEVTTDGVDTGLNPNANQKFVLVLTETSGKLKDAAEEFALVDASGNAIKDPDNNNNEVKVKFDANSQAKVTIKAGQTVVVKGLPVGVTIVVTEEPAAGYTPSFAPRNSATIVENNDTTPAVSVEVTNNYVPDSYNASTLFTFTKTLTSNGIALTDKTFEFVAHLADAQGNLSHERASVMYGTVKVSSGTGAVAIDFDELKLSMTGTYYYLVTESVGSDGGIYYDPTEFLISFEVYDDGSGQLKLRAGSVTLKARANVDQDWTAAADWDFENIYTPKPTEVVLHANKVLNNRVLENELFTFEVIDTKNNNKVVATAKNKADGSITFPAITYTAAGEYVYNIYEVNGGRQNYTYDTTKHVVTVVVIDDGVGNLKVSTINGVAAESFDFTGFRFTNTYTPVSAVANVQIEKDLIGRVQIAGEFDFTLSGDGLASALTAKNDANGNVVFPQISYTLADIGYPANTSKTFTYTIAENPGSDSHIAYTTDTVTVNVTVSYDATSGLMSAVVTYPNGSTLTNTFTPDPIQVAPVGTKVTDNYTAVDANTTFSFKVVDNNDQTLLNGTSGLNGQITYDGKFTYTKSDIGTHGYWIYEVNGGTTVSGMTYDGSIHYMRVVVSQHAVTGVLSADVKYYEVNAIGSVDEAVPAADASFRNSYAAEGTFTLTAEKILSGRDLKDNEFKFILKDSVGNLIKDAQGNSEFKADENGLIMFPAITLTAAGDFVYYASEVVPSDAEKLGGVTYDTNTYAIHVNVVDNGGGKYVGTVTDVKVNGDSTGLKSVVFNNTYSTGNASITLEAVKDVIGHAYTMTGGEFLFEVKNAAGTVVAIGRNDANGKVVFDKIYGTTSDIDQGYTVQYTFADFLKSDTYVYTITEVNTVPNGFSHDTAAYTVTIKLADDGKGNLSVSTINGVRAEDFDFSAISFINTYAPTSTSAQITAEKILNGRTPKNGEFWFVLEDESDNLIFASNVGKDVTFRPITYTAVGEYKYTVSEVSGSLGGVSYDNTSYEVTVKVTDDKGALKAEVIYPTGGVKFTNSYSAAPTSYRLAVNKILSGRNLNADEFRFEMADNTGKVVSIAYNASAMDGDNALALFNAIEYTVAGTYTYTVYEKTGDLGGVTYDNTVYTVEITVTDDGLGQLHAAVTKVNSTDYSDANPYKPENITFENSYKPADTSITLGTEGTVDISKVLTGRPLKGGEFTFVLTDVSGTPIDTAENDVDGKVVFDKIDYTYAMYLQSQTYTYKIYEDGKGSTVDGVTKDGKEYIVTVTLTDNLKGQLVATVSKVEEGTNEITDKKITFENSYRTDNAEITLVGDKVVTGHYFDITADKFHFVVKDLSGKVVAEGTNAAAVNKAQIAEIVFGTITYTFEDYLASDTYTYIISEKASNIPGMSDDKSEFIVTVVLTDDGKGTLTATATYPNTEGKVTFTNTYKPTPTSIILQANKKLDVEAGSLQLSKDQFSFYLARQLSNGQYLLLENKGNEASGLIEFAPIEFTEAGTYTFAIGENVGHNGAGGITYDHDVYILEVTVEDINGQLDAEITAMEIYDGQNTTSVAVDSLREFVNIYEAKPVEVDILAGKELSGKDLENKEFRFMLEDADGNKIYETNDINGLIKFKKQFTQVGTYKFTLSETPETVLDYITYDATKHEVTVVVADDGKGQLYADVYYGPADALTEAVPVFKNTYTPNEVSVDLTLEEMVKALTGRDLVADEFIFEVKDADGNVVSTGKNDADGNIVFDKKLTFTEKGEYTFTVYEVAGDDTHITYDGTVHTMNVTVTDDGKGTLTAEVTYGVDGTGEKPEFENTYTPDKAEVVLEALKVLVGRDLTDEEFTFEVKDAAGNVVATGKNDADGKIVFGKIELSAGEYTYTVYEVAGDAEDTIYDETVFEVTVKISDEDKDGVYEQKITYPEDGVKFVNEHYEEVDTGDNSQMGLWITLAVLCVAAVGAVIVLRKKFR